MAETTQTGFVIPSLAEAIADARESMAAALPANINPATPLTLENALANALGLLTVVAARQTAAALRESSPETASREGLIRIGSRRGVPPNDATRWTGEVTFTGDEGEIVPAGTQFTREDGTAYVTTEAGEIGEGSATVTAQSVDFGAATELPEDTECRLSVLIDGVSSTCVCATNNQDASDAEETEPYRGRVLATFNNEPWGGTIFDWQRWIAGASTNVARVFVQNSYYGAATVRVLFTVQPEYDAETGLLDPLSVIPDETALDVVRDYMALDGNAVLGVELAIQAPVAKQITCELDVYPRPVELSTKIAIAKEIDALFAQYGPDSTIRNSHFRGAVQRGLDATGVSDAYFVLMSLNGGSAAGDLTCTDSQIFTRGTITWTPY